MGRAQLVGAAPPFDVGGGPRRGQILFGRGAVESGAAPLRPVGGLGGEREREGEEAEREVHAGDSSNDQ